MNAVDAMAWFAACPRGMEDLLAAELGALGASRTKETVAGVHFEGPLALGYRTCLWSRLANRVLLPLGDFDAPDADALYRGLKGVDWRQVLDPRCSIAIDFSGENRAIRNTRFGAQRSKDAIVDWFEENGGVRPDVDRRRPDLRINVRLSDDRATVSLDFSGGSLHRRGYRSRQGEAPLKENLAAAILLRADWPGMAARGGALIDPMCGSATLLIEGALMAADRAPALGRRQFGFEQWRGHQAQQWQAILADAQGRADRGMAAQLPEIRGYDGDRKVVFKAQENIAEAGLEKLVRVSCKSLAALKKPSHRPLPDGLVLSNPPYGERLGEKQSLAYLYRELGEALSREFQGWQAAIFTADLDLGKAVGLRSHQRYALYNGPIKTYLLLFTLVNNRLRDIQPAPDEAAAAAVRHKPLTPGAEMFANRLRKNRRRLKPWLKREQPDCYRLYDADMPEYAVAVDVYGDSLHVSEYKAPKGVEEAAARLRLEEVMAALPAVTDVPRERIALKQRQRQRGREQYAKQDTRDELLSVREGRARLLVNLWDYLDTGLFLDHRPLRLRIAEEVEGRDFLNLFCYTGAATVHAALAGARTTTSVDLSNTYLDWLRKNLAHNGLPESGNRLVKANCLAWLSREDRLYDLILLDPPSFSNSRAMRDSFDVQRDQVSLVEAAMDRLRPSGLLYFSNNRRGFKIDQALLEAFNCEDISAQTLGPDFQRGQPIHQAWAIRHREKSKI
ncbi:MAG: bifunctional 23S rRNA (guanine(2069)-N(7))-methyltransferase RlmK/23S rRNA (guanine(2445)-N(2))-methyltransferase RlmL [Pseudomonadota bacterium]